MNALKVKGMSIVTDEQRTDPATGEQYHARVLVGHGHTIELNEDKHGYSARADGDWRTAATRMDEGGVFTWLSRLFGR
jgi:hypothetical protein